MPITVDYSSQVYNGATSGVALPVTFQGLSAAYIYCAILPLGDTVYTNLIKDTDYTVTDLGGGEFEVTTTATYISTTKVQIYRYLPYVQTTELPEGTRLPVAGITSMADYVTCLVQQIRVEAGISGAAVPSPISLNGVAVFANSTARGLAIPAYLSQPGVQTDTGAIYIGGPTLVAGAWVLFVSGTVNSVAASGGTTGLTFTGSPITSSGTLTLSGTLAVANGGTGQTTAQAAINALLAASGALVAGDVFWYNGTNVVRLAASNGVLTNTAGTVSWGSAGTGDVVGPASSVDSRVAMFDATTGKLLKNAAGTNDTAVTIDAGTISDTTSRPLTISQTWNNSGLTATGMTLAITDTSSGANSLAFSISVGGVVFSIAKTGAVVSNSTVTSVGFLFPSSTRVTAPVDGELLITNSGTSSGLRLKTAASANTATFRTFNDSNYANIDANSIQARGPIVTPYYEKAALPTPSSWTRGLIWVQDDVGGATIAWCDGTDWRRIRDNVIIS